MVGSAGEVKAMVATGQVGTQKRKKIMAGDTIEFWEKKFTFNSPQLATMRIMTSQEPIHDQ